MSCFFQFFQEQEKQPEIEHKMTETDLDSIAQSISEAIEFAEGYFETFVEIFMLQCFQKFK